MTSASGPYGPRELASDLQRLLELPAQSEAEQDAWYEQARQVGDRIQASSELHSIPHTLHHFFSDADVRAKEPGVRDMQFEQVRRHIAVLETGVVPGDDSQSVSVGELLRGLWRSLRTRLK